MGRILIAGREYPLPDNIPVTTYLDRGGFTFYESTAPEYRPLRAQDEYGDERPLVFPRRVPGMAPGSIGLGGRGWDVLDPDPIKALRRAIRSIVLHHDGSSSSQGCYRTLLGRGYSTHFLIDRNGHLYQAADVADKTIHATILNEPGIGIDLNNIAPNLLSTPDATMEGGQPSGTMVINGNSFQSWKYTDEQYESLIALLRVLVRELEIDPVFPVDEQGRILPSVLANPPVEQFRGIVCHWHIQPEKWDPGPGLEWERILAGLRKEEATFPVIPAGLADALRDPIPGLDFSDAELRDSEAARRVLDMALGSEATAGPFLDAVSRSVERQDAGGYYPMGINQTWHGGIHIETGNGAPVRAMLKGDLVAARLVGEKDFPDLGSCNFVLLRHRIPVPLRVAPGEEAGCGEVVESALVEREPPPVPMLTVFSLYMHLAPVDWSNPGDNELVSALLKRTHGEPDFKARPLSPKPEVLPIKQERDQVKALRQGFVGLFSSDSDPGGAIAISAGTVIGHAWEFGASRESDSQVVHLEVFTDSTFLEVMEMALYGRILRLGPDDPSGVDLVVRSSSLLGRFQVYSRPSGRRQRAPSPAGGKVLTPDDIRNYFQDAIPEELDDLRRMVVAHLSEWSTSVDWIRTLLVNQNWYDRWFGRLSGEPGARWVFRREVEDWLAFAWLDDAVIAHLGLRDGPYVHTFHPVQFLKWWLFLRSAVRAKSLEEILRCVQGQQITLGEGVPEVLGDLLDMPGQGEWDL